MEGNYNQSNSPIKEPFSCDYRISIYLQNNKLGHKDIHIYLNKDNFNLVAAMTTDTTPKLLEISQQLGMLYGIPFKKIIKNESYSSHYYFIF